MPIKVVLCIALGGGVGSLLRFATASFVQRSSGGVFPLGTLAVNTAGCLLIGFLGALLAGPLLVREEVRLGLLVGLLGGFTTFSTFGWETLALLEDGEWARAAANVAASNLLGLAAVWAGLRLAQQLGTGA